MVVIHASPDKGGTKERVVYSRRRKKICRSGLTNLVASGGQYRGDSNQSLVNPGAAKRKMGNEFKTYGPWANLSKRHLSTMLERFEESRALGTRTIGQRLRHEGFHRIAKKKGKASMHKKGETVCAKRKRYSTRNRNQNHLGKIRKIKGGA